MKSYSHTLLTIIGMLILFSIGTYNLLDTLNANWIPDVFGYEWVPENQPYGRIAKIAACFILIFIPIFTFAFYTKSKFAPKAIVCKHNTGIIRLSQKTIIKTLKQVLLRIPNVVAVNIKAWNKGTKVYVVIGSTIKAGASLPELNQEIKIRTRDTLIKILGIPELGEIKSVIEDIKFTDKEAVGRMLEDNISNSFDAPAQKTTPAKIALKENQPEINVFASKINSKLADNIEESNTPELPGTEAQNTEEKEKF